MPAKRAGKARKTSIPKSAGSSLPANLKAAGYNPSLPAALLDEQGRVQDANKRMRILLGLAQEAQSIANSAVAATWPFFNEEFSKTALWKKIASFHPRARTVLTAENGLKTFRLHLGPGLSSGERLLVIELMRTGDLLKDDGSSETLFRSLAHEIRTATSALHGYLDMIADRGATAEVLDRMKVSLGRLDGVVARLKDFRSQMRDEGDT